MFGVTKFRQYLLGRHFTLMTDHKPLVTLFNEHKPMSQLASARIKKRSLLLAAYDDTIQFIKGKENVYVDYLSRKPLQGHPPRPEQVTVEVLLVKNDKIMKADVVAAETKKDPILSKGLHFTKHGWNENPEDGIRPYHNKRLELSVENDIILWDSRVVIPTSLWQDLHAEHSGMVKMKQMVRRYLWWPNIDKDIENTVR